MTRLRRLYFAALMAAGCQSNGRTAVTDAGAADGLADTGVDAPSVPTVCEAGSVVPCPPLSYATWVMPGPPGVPSKAPSEYTLTAETATETTTRLVWQRSSTEKQTWSDAKSYCGGLNLRGQDDWRLPSRIELVSLVDFTRLPSIDQEAFPETPNDYFWSASSTATDERFAFSVYFGAGLTAFGATTGRTGHVRCVRGGGPGALPRYDVDATTVKDNNTELLWRRQPFEQPLAWDSAKDYCAGIGTGWRLPSTKELQTIVDETRSSPAVDSDLFPQTPSAFFWTSTPANKPGLMNGVFVSMIDGSSEEASPTDAYWVRCVR